MRQLSAGKGTYVLLGFVVAISVFPLYWSFVAASRDNSDISRMPPSLLPGGNANRSASTPTATSDVVTLSPLPA